MFPLILILFLKKNLKIQFIFLTQNSILERWEGILIVIKEVVTKQDDYLFITSPVLVPGEADCDYNRGEKPLTAEEVRKLAYSFMDYRIIDKEHDYLTTKKAVATPVESYLTTEPTSWKSVDGQVREYPTGTWMLKSMVTDPTAKRKVLSGEYTGTSVTAISKSTADKLAMKESAGKLIKDIENPVGYTVSLVKEPCVGSAKFCKNKIVNIANGDKMAQKEDNNVLAALKEALGIENKTEEKLEYVTKEDFDNGIASIKEASKEAIVEAIKELQEEKKKKEEEEEETDEGNSSTNSNSNSNTDGGSSSEEEEEEEDDEKKKKIKESEKECKNKKNKEGKALKSHNNNPPAATKSAASTVYEIMGRDSTGSVLPKKQ